MLNRISNKLKLITNACKAFQVIYKKQHHAFFAKDFYMVDAKISEIAGYKKVLTNLVENAIDQKNINDLTNEVKEILKS